MKNGYLDELSKMTEESDRRTILETTDCWTIKTSVGVDVNN